MNSLFSSLPYKLKEEEKIIKKPLALEYPNGIRVRGKQEFFQRNLIGNMKERDLSQD